MNKIKLAFVGCGSFANVTATVAKLNPKIEISLCYDTNKQTAEKFKKRFKAQDIANSYQEVLDSEVDAIYLPIPHFLHYDYIKRALLANKHVFTEKPLCLTYIQGKEVTILAKEKRLMLCVNFHNRYVKAVQKAKRKIENGDIGDIGVITVQVPWSRDEKYINPDNWHGKKLLSGGGTLVTQGIHALDIALWCIDSKVSTIYGYQSKMKFKNVETEDTFSLNIGFENKTSLQMFSTMALKKEIKAELNFYGTKASLKLKLPSALGFITAVYKSLDDFASSIISRNEPKNFCENFLLVTNVVENAYKSADEEKIIVMT